MPCYLGAAMPWRHNHRITPVMSESTIQNTAVIANRIAPAYDAAALAKWQHHFAGAKETRHEPSYDYAPELLTRFETGHLAANCEG